MSALTLKDVANAIGWLDNFGSDLIEFDSFSVTENEDESLTIHVEGYYRPQKGQAVVTEETRDRLSYAFDHLVGSYNPEDPHHGDSRDLAGDVLTEVLGGTEDALAVIGALDIIAEHVAGNYEWTGEARDYQRRIENGEV